MGKHLFVSVFIIFDVLILIQVLKLVLDNIEDDIRDLQLDSSSGIIIISTFITRKLIYFYIIRFLIGFIFY